MRISLSKNLEFVRKIDNYKTVGRRVKDLREARDRNATRNTQFFKQVEMANIFDMQSQNWNKIEAGRANGGNNPTVEHLIGMSVYWGVPIDYLVTGEYPSVLKMSDAEAEPNDELKKELEHLKEKLAAKEEVIASQKTTIETLKSSLDLMKAHQQ